MMTNYNRRDFISSVSKGLIGCSLCPNVALCDDFYEDIVVGEDFYCFNHEWTIQKLFSGSGLITLLRNSFYVYDKCDQLDSGFDKFSTMVNKHSSCKLRVFDHNNSYKDHVINVTFDWCKQFYRIHKDENLLFIHEKQYNSLNNLIDRRTYHDTSCFYNVEKEIKFHKKGQKELENYIDSNIQKIYSGITSADYFCFIYYNGEWDKIKGLYDCE